MKTIAQINQNIKSLLVENRKNMFKNEQYKKKIELLLKVYYEDVVNLYNSSKISNTSILSNVSYNSIDKKMLLLNKTLSKDLINIIKDNSTEYAQNSYSFSKSLRKYLINPQIKVKKLNADELADILNYRYFGYNYKERVLTQVDSLSRKIKQNIVNNIENDLSLNIFKANINKSLNTLNSNILTLTTTESTRVSSFSFIKDLKEDENLNRVIIIATLDGKTSSICQNKDSKIIDLNKATINELPPFHPNCRTDFAPYVDTANLTRLNNITKEKIPFLTYPEFKKKYLV